MSHTWNTLLQVAILGTERAPLKVEATGDALGELLQKIPTDDAALSLLRSAGATSLYHAAGAKPAVAITSTIAPCEPDEKPEINMSAAMRWHRIMDESRYHPLLKEWTTTVAQRGFHLPAASLPRSLNFASNYQWQDIVRPLLGKRGQWLAAQNLAWQWAVGASSDDPEKFWQTATREQRLVFFEQLRQSDPAQARLLLEKDWHAENPKDRAKFIEMFRQNLSDADELFLERALDDKIKEVRWNAAGRLAELPHSAFVRRMQERLTPLLSFTHNRKSEPQIKVTLPNECDKSMQRDGIEKKNHNTELGEKGAWLQHMLKCVPNRFWCEQSGWTAEQLVAAAERSSWKKVLIEGWCSSIYTHSDTDWARAIYQRKKEDQVSLLRFLPPQEAVAIVKQVLKESPSLQSSREKRQYFFHIAEPWPDALSQCLVDSLIWHAKNEGFQNHWNWPFLPHLGVHIAADYIPMLLNTLLPVSQAAGNPPPLEQFLEFMQFRYEMLKEITS